MTVKELIEKLQTIPEDTEVITYGDNGHFWEEVTTIEYYDDGTVFIG